MEVLSSRVLLRPADPAASTAFYRDTLGLAVAREFPGGTVFFAGATLLEVSSHAAGDGAGSTSLWLQVRDLDATHDELVAAGVAFDRGPRTEPWGLREAWLRDPDGVRLVLVEVPDGHPLRTDTR
ncbi:VOC family protein [Rhodococcus aerolatus]